MYSLIHATDLLGKPMIEAQFREKLLFYKITCFHCVYYQVASSKAKDPAIIVHQLYSKKYILSYASSCYKSCNNSTIWLRSLKLILDFFETRNWNKVLISQGLQTL